MDRRSAYIFGTFLIILGWLFDILLVLKFISVSPNYIIEGVGLIFVGFSHNKSWTSKWQVVGLFLWITIGLTIINVIYTGLDPLVVLIMELFTVVLYLGCLGVGYFIGNKFVDKEEKEITSYIS